MPRKLHPDTAALLGALLKKLRPRNKTILLTKEEIAEAPDVEMKENFDTETVELRTSTYTDET